MQKLKLYQGFGADIKSFIIDSVDADLYVKSEDFVVGEILDGRIYDIKKENLNFKNIFSQKYIHATLVKSGISTIDACHHLAIKNNLSFTDITYCGLKDTFGLTSQKICIFNPGCALTHIKFNNFFLKDFTGSDQPLRPRDNEGNHFIIRVRNVKNIEQALKTLNKLIKEEILLPNFYGPQRFGIRQQNYILGRLLLEGHYQELLNRFLTDTNDHESKKIQKIRKQTKGHLGDWRTCYQLLSGVNGLDDEKELINDLLKGRDLLQSIKMVKILELWIHAFSSYLFNLALSKYLQQKKEISKNIKLNKIGINTVFNNNDSDLYSLIFQQEKISPSIFQQVQPGFVVQGRLRNAFFCPKNLILQQQKNDIILEFSLGSGEYASLFLDFIFNNRRGFKLN